jgi:hypothetical protein
MQVRYLPNRHLPDRRHSERQTVAIPGSGAGAFFAYKQTHKQTHKQTTAAALHQLNTACSA